MKLIELFKRKKKDVNEHTSPRIITFACPNCGKEHSVQYRKARSYYLDGTPQDLEKALSMCVVCDCGCLCQENYLFDCQNWAELIARPAHQSILRGDYTDVERKLRIMTLYPGVYGIYDVWLTHAVSPDKMHDSLRHAISKIKSSSPHFVNCVVNGCYMPQFQWKWSFCIEKHLQLADMYRRIGEFELAATILNDKAQQKQNNYLDEYIQLQTKLIEEKNAQEK